MSGDAVDAAALRELADDDDLAACHALPVTEVAALQNELEDVLSPDIPVTLVGLPPPALHPAQLPAVPSPASSGPAAPSSSSLPPANVQPCLDRVLQLPMARPPQLLKARQMPQPLLILASRTRKLRTLSPSMRVKGPPISAALMIVALTIR